MGEHTDIIDIYLLNRFLWGQSSLPSSDRLALYSTLTDLTVGTQSYLNCRPNSSWLARNGTTPLILERNRGESARTLLAKGQIVIHLTWVSLRLVLQGVWSVQINCVQLSCPQFLSA